MFYEMSLYKINTVNTNHCALLLSQFWVLNTSEAGYH